MFVFFLGPWMGEWRSICQILPAILEWNVGWQGEQTHIHVALWWLTQNSTSLGPSWGLAVQGDPGFWLPFHLGYDWVDLGWRLRVRVPLCLGAQRKLKAISRLEAKWTSPLPLLGRRDSSPADPKKAALSAAMDSWMPSGHLHSPHWADPDHPLESYVPGMFELRTRYILDSTLLLHTSWVNLGSRRRILPHMASYGGFQFTGVPTVIIHFNQHFL